MGESQLDGLSSVAHEQMASTGSAFALEAKPGMLISRGQFRSVDLRDADCRQHAQLPAGRHFSARLAAVIVSPSPMLRLCHSRARLPAGALSNVDARPVAPYQL